MVNKRVNAVLQLKDPSANVDEVMARLAQYALDNFSGSGGNPLASQIEDYLGWVNTPTYGVYFTVEIDIGYGIIFELIQASITPEDEVSLVRVEWLTDEVGETIVYPEITYTVEVTDPDTGEVTFRQQPIGRKP